MWNSVLASTSIRLGMAWLWTRLRTHPASQDSGRGTASFPSTVCLWLRWMIASRPSASTLPMVWRWLSSRTARRAGPCRPPEQASTGLLCRATSISFLRTTRSSWRRRPTSASSAWPGRSPLCRPRARRQRSCWPATSQPDGAGAVGTDTAKECLQLFPEIMGPEWTTPDCERGVRVSMEASLREMSAPGALAIPSPLAAGLGFDKDCCAGLLSGAFAPSVQPAVPTRHLRGRPGAPSRTSPGAPS
mmetsp:Transcript_111049/g.347440  ORF Transcript_111049/g.347440 Transcript_111049/m.347440 type:complete len:246 (+) Transcript_111049:44-781(+)